MLLALLVVLAAAPVYWFLIPAGWRKAYLTAASFVGLGIYDLRLPFVLTCVSVILFAAVRLIEKADDVQAKRIRLLGFSLILALFWFNKFGDRDSSTAVVATQSGLVFLGISYLTLKATAVLVTATRGSLGNVSLLSIGGWLAFLPTYICGPIEDLNHFARQEPRFDKAQVLEGMQRILFGCVRAFVFSKYLAEWGTPILESPEGYSPPFLLMAACVWTLCFYFDFAGYSDIAVGLGKIHGYTITENFNNPLLKRNLSLLWQNWHMSLTRWIRIYVFTPLTRAIMKRAGPGLDVPVIMLGQLCALGFCGLWHAASFDFALWAGFHSIGLIWMSVGVRPAGRYMPQGFVRWWRRSPVGYAGSNLMGVVAFSLGNIFGYLDYKASLKFFTHLVGLA